MRSSPPAAPTRFMAMRANPDGASADRLLIFDFVVQGVVPGTIDRDKTDAVSFYVSDFLETDEMIEEWIAAIFDSSHNVLETQVGNASNALVSFSRPFPDISRATFGPSQDQEGIDTLTFNTPVPEPELISLFLVSIGLAAASLRIRESSHRRMT
jgi:hypothetical protein